MKYFIDTEFHETGSTIELISIAIVAEDGREFYAESSEYDWSKASEWLKENVKPHLWAGGKVEGNRWSRDGGVGGLMGRKEIAAEVLRFCNPERHGKPEFWGYYCDYDWVVFCWLFGAMIDLPEGFPMYCRDLKQEMDRLNFRSYVPKGTEHHALFDARWIKESYESMRSFE